MRRWQWLVLAITLIAGWIAGESGYPGWATMAILGVLVLLVMTAPRVGVLCTPRLRQVPNRKVRVGHDAKPQLNETKGDPMNVLRMFLTLFALLPLLAACATGAPRGHTSIFQAPATPAPSEPVLAEPLEAIKDLFYGKRVLLEGFSDPYLREAVLIFVPMAGGQVVSGTRNADLRIRASMRSQHFGAGGRHDGTIGAVLVGAVRVNGRRIFTPRPTTRWRAEITVLEVEERGEALRLHSVGEEDCFSDSSRSVYCDNARRRAAYAAFNAFVPQVRKQSAPAVKPTAPPAAPAASPAPRVEAPMVPAAKAEPETPGGLVVKIK